MATTGQALRRGIGATLRAERERRHVSLDAVARGTLVRQDFLELIDADRLEELPDRCVREGLHPLVRRVPRTRPEAVPQGVRRSLRQARPGARALRAAGCPGATGGAEASVEVRRRVGGIRPAPARAPRRLPVGRRTGRAPVDVRRRGAHGRHEHRAERDGCGRPARGDLGRDVGGGRGRRSARLREHAPARRVRDVQGRREDRPVHRPR